MKQLYTLLLLLWLLCGIMPQTIQASNDKNALGGKAGSMGGASITNADAFSIFANQATLARVQSFTAGIYAENRFLLTDLSLYAVGIALPTKAGSFGVGIQYFGNTDYNEKQFRLGYGRTLFEKLDLGIELSAVSVGMNEYGSAMAFTFGIGMVYSFNDKLQVGAHVYNPLRIALTNQTEDRLPTLLKVGLNYSPSEKASIMLETEKNLDSSFMLKVGIEYRPIDKLYIRGGISNSPAQYCLGVGLNLGKIKIDAGAALHESLGYTPMVSLSFGK
jgi:long-subunit fatty acid transport protein